MEEKRPIGPLVIGGGIAGAIAGAAAGYSLFGWLIQEHGLYSQAMPAAITGLGCGWASGRRVWLLALWSLLLGSAVGLLCEYSMRTGAPGSPDPTFVEFLGQIGDLPAGVQFRLGIGALLAGWLGLGRDRPPAKE